MLDKNRHYLVVSIFSVYFVVMIINEIIRIFTIGKTVILRRCPSVETFCWSNCGDCLRLVHRVGRAGLHPYINQQQP